MSTLLASSTYTGDLGGGLICRWSTHADTEKIGLLLSTVHRDRADEPLNIRSQDRVRVFMGGRFPFMDAGDFAVVEDTSQPERPIVACTCLWRHRWSYANISFGVGRPEYVATDAAYRNRGLVRALFDMVHARSAAEGHLLQAITGIPYFYRQFGYEFVLDLEGSRTVQFSHIPDKKGDDPEPYRLRLARTEDIPLLSEFYDQQRGDSLLWHESDESYWRFIVDYWNDPTVPSRDATTLGVGGGYFMIVDNTDVAVGSIWIDTRRWGRSLFVRPALNSAPQVNRQTVMACLLRLLRDRGAQTPAVEPETPPCSEIIFTLGPNHPIYELLGEKLAMQVERPYAWYVRIPDIPAFIRQIAPVLEGRLERSMLAGHTGEITIDLYRSGLKVRFEQGKIIEVTPWRPPAYGDEAMAGSPPLLFLQLLLSYRSLDELRAFYPDVLANDEAKLLLDILFPKQRSVVLEPLE